MSLKCRAFLLCTFFNCILQVPPFAMIRFLFFFRFFISVGVMSTLSLRPPRRCCSMMKCSPDPQEVYWKILQVRYHYIITHVRKCASKNRNPKRFSGPYKLNGTEYINMYRYRYYNHFVDGRKSEILLPKFLVCSWYKEIKKR